MANDKVMIAAGFGCRKGCGAQDLLGVFERALRSADKTRSDVTGLFAPEFKRDERGLHEAAELLGLPLSFLPLPELQAQTANTATQSEQARARAGVPSVAETAALAGAAQLNRQGAYLLVARQIFGAATCALAGSLACPTGTFDRDQRRGEP
jgi:cobalt-precorrin 5A hydrolase